MFCYSPAFTQVAGWARDGVLGDLFAVRAHTCGDRPPDRSAAHERLVQETLLRATGRISETVEPALSMAQPDVSLSDCRLGDPPHAGKPIQLRIDV